MSTISRATQRHHGHRQQRGAQSGGHDEPAVHALQDLAQQQRRTCCAGDFIVRTPIVENIRNMTFQYFDATSTVPVAAPATTESRPKSRSAPT